MNHSDESKIYGTTICCVQKDGVVAMGGDGQVSLGQTILKGNATKVRKIYSDKVIAGFAGSTADAFTLLELFEEKLQKYGGNLLRAAVELAKDWRMDKMLRRLEAMMIVSDGKKIFLLSGNGDVIEPEDNIIAIGSGGNFALAAGRAYLENSKYTAAEIAKKSLEIAADICVYTNHNITILELKE
ncbi:MAG: ATP-dependent protease subunit HslV [Spirochaetia bacterium]|nr:ATP-dependent protease subunit HslV [Spirochaetia bacterium]